MLAGARQPHMVQALRDSVHVESFSDPLVAGMDLSDRVHGRQGAG